MGSTIRLTPDRLSTEISPSLLPASCGPVSAEAFRDNQVRPLVWLIFGGTGALGRQISRLAIGRRDKVMVAALDKEYDPADWSFHQEVENEAKSKATGFTSNGNNNSMHYKGYSYYGGPTISDTRNKRPHDDMSEGPSKSSRLEDKKRKRPDPFLYIASEFKDSCCRVECDVRIRSSVDSAVQRCVALYGRIDVVVNCFGYGVVGACEDQVDSEVRSQFEVNFMGLFHTLRAVLPYLTTPVKPDAKSTDKSRANVSNSAGSTITGNPGHIISFTSSMGVLGAPGFGPYSATRWAAEGLLESLAIEVEHLGCKVTIIETGFAKSGDMEDKMRVATP